MSGPRRRDGTPPDEPRSIHSGAAEDPKAIATGMTLADISIRNHVFAWILMIGLMFFGFICFAGWGGVVRGLGISQNPDIDSPWINIQLTYEGASPQTMETDVVDFVEDAVTSIEGVKQISSTSRQGSANVSVEFELSRDIDAAVQDVQTKVAQAARRLPRELEPPIVTKQNPEDQPIMWLALGGSRSPTFLADYVKNVVRPSLQTLPGVGEVVVFGHRERSIRVWFDANRLESRGVTIQDVLDAIGREHLEVPAGRIETDTRELNVRAFGEAIDLDQFRKLVILSKDGAPVRLEDVSVVEDGLEDKRRVARSMGEPAVGFGIRKLRGANAVEVGDLVRGRLEELSRELPEGLSFGVNFDSTVFVKQAVDEILFTLVMAALLTGFVCWLFLGSWSSTINVLLAIPTSILGTFIVMYGFGFTLNTFTVLGLSLTVGIIVDDAIMVLENIYRHRENGEGKVKAASIGAREITFAAAAATGAIVAIFLPVAFMKGLIGKYFFQFGVTISVAVILSLLEALTLTPMRCSRFLEVGARQGRVGQAAERVFERLSRGYQRTLAPALDHRVAVLVGSTLFFVLSLGLFGVLKKEMVPTQDMSSLTVRLQAPVGTSIDAMDRNFAAAESFLLARPEVKRIFGSVGGFGGGDVNTAVIFITLKDPGDRPRDGKLGRRPTQADVTNTVRAGLNAIPGIKAAVQDPSQQAFGGNRGAMPVEMSIHGSDWDRLAEYSRQIMEKMRATGLMADIDSNYLLGMPEVQVHADRDRAADLGVSMAAIGQTISAAIGGTRAGKFEDGGHRYDIRVRLLSPQRQKSEDIRRLLVRTSSGALVRLGDLIRIDEHAALQSITRKDRQRAITVTANIAPGASQAEAIAASMAAAHEVLPEGYRAALAGSAQTFQESLSSLWFAFAMGLIVAYMVLATQFNAFSHPFTVLLALPFSVSGALIMLWVSGQTMNVYSMLGLILLMGIAKKNSILLVDFTNQIRDEGKETRPALMTACPLRLRPILMTSVSTIAGALPAALALGPGAEVQRPMALALVGGMIVSTLLTLYVVPCAYSALDDAIRWLERRRARSQGDYAGSSGPGTSPEASSSLSDRPSHARMPTKIQ
jgi:hydrophobe/amphiphile efflux-1 (HAE1) family protein